MSWNYRVCKETYRKGEETEEIGFTIREAYYNKDGSIWAVTERATGIVGDNIDDIKQCLEWMQLSLTKDIIDLDNIVFAKADFEKDDGIDWSEIDNPDFGDKYAEQLKKLEDNDKLV